MKYILTIDPGLTATAITLWNESLWGDVAQSYVTSHVIYPAKTIKGTPARLSELAKKLRHIYHLERSDICKVWIEHPEYYDTQGGQVSAESGALVTLCIATGVIFHIMDSISPGNVNFIKPSEWKGQVSKEQMKRRLQGQVEGFKGLSDAILSDIERSSNHVWDAVGIGESLQRKGK